MSQFQEIGGAARYINVAPKGVPAFKEGDVIIEGTFNRTFQGKFGLQHEFKVGNEAVVVNGFGALNHKLKMVEPNTLVRVVYNGKPTLTKGKYAGQKFHDCKVFTAATSTPNFQENVATDTGTEDDSFLE